MKISHLLHVFLLGVCVTGRDLKQVKPNRHADGDGHSSSTGTRKFIVEVESNNHLGALTRQLQAKSGKNNTYYKAFDCSDVFSGLSIETDSDNIDSIREMEGVVNAWPMRSIPRSRVVKQTNFAPPIRSNYSVHQWTGVDRLHAQGIRGKGATVAIVDTGIDYHHQALGGCFGPGCKIAGGYDLVGAYWDTYSQKQYPKRPDDDPMDFEGHGTHVAGIIAADSNRVIGVAPDAKLLIYKIFSDRPWDSDEETVIQAFCDAYHAGADVITASLGEVNGFSDNPWALVASRLVDKGIVVVASAGNEGDSGPFYASSGSSGPGVLAVAAVNATGARVNKAILKNQPVPGYFTTWGPTNELLIKPDIGAPGWDVLSTLLNQTYGDLSGTSMAAPYIAGVAALYIGEYGGREYFGPGFAKMLRDRIASSGKTLPWTGLDTWYNFTAPPFQVGTGLVDAWKVLKYKTELGYEPFALMDKQFFNPHWKINITNHGLLRERYHFKLEPAAGVNILDDFFGIEILYGLKPYRIVPNVTLPGPIVVEPGETKEVDFTFSLPDVDEDMLPLYSGKVWVLSGKGEKLSIPYGGAAYDTEKAFSRMFVTNPTIWEGRHGWSWSFNVAKDPGDYLELTANLAYPCFHLRWDIFHDWWTENSWTWPLKVDNLGYIGSAATMRDAENYWFYDPALNNKDDTVPFPNLRVPRGYQNYWWFGKLANGTQIPPGNYTIRFAALRPYGNPAISSHWDVMYNPVRSIQVLPINTTITNSTQTYRWVKKQ